MITAVLCDMGGTLEDIWVDEESHTAAVAALDRMLKSAVELPEEPRYRKDAEFLVYSALDEFYVRHGYSERFLALLWEELVVDALTTRNLAVVETDGEEE